MDRFATQTRHILDRRRFLRTAGMIGFSGFGLLRSQPWEILTAESITLPFENGERPLVRYPQKRPLIRITTRPPQLETPFSVFDESVLTPNDGFFVRYHLSESPPLSVDLKAFRLEVKGMVKSTRAFSVADLKSQFEQVEIVAVNQCSGNGRGLFQPRVPGGQMGNGAMGNARWRGVRLKDLLNEAGLEAGARQVTFNGLDTAIVEKTPDYIKALEIDHALDREVLVAYAMNGEDLPMLNGYPLRLVVPGYYGTYWVKHLNEITVINEVYTGYWMNPAYRIPDNACACVDPGSAAQKTIPINRLNVRSFITSLKEGDQLKVGEVIQVKGIAFDGGYGIRQVLFSEDGGAGWREAELGRDLGRYSFREWQVRFTPRRGPMELSAKATNRIGQSQPLDPLWNPAGYMRNAVEKVKVAAV